MAIQGVDTKCYILALFVRDDGERFLLGSGHYEFKDTQMHFAANAIQNDIVEVQGNDGFLLAGQVRRPGTQSFDGYVGDGTMSKEETEAYRRQFFSFFRKNFFYKVIYVFSDGTAIQRKRGFLVDDPTVQELYQIYPEYHVALNFEDVNYYSYSEDDEGQEQYAKEATIDTSSMRATGGLVWDNLGVVWEATQWGGEQTASGTEMTIQNEMDMPSRVDDIRLDGDTEQQVYSGKNLCALGTKTVETYTLFPLEKSLPAGTYTFSAQVTSTDTQSSVCFVRFMNGSSGVGAGRISRSDERAYITITTSNTADGLYLYAGYDAQGSAGDTATYTDIQIEAGSTATDYEPYTGGIPAPSPDYPQDIQVVTGEQTVTVSGANLYDYTDTKSVSTGVTADSDGWITAAYNNTGGSTVYLQYFTDLLPLENNTNYAIAIEVKNVSGNGALDVCTSYQGQFTSVDNYLFSQLEGGKTYIRTETTKASFDGSIYSLRTVINFASGQSGSITFRISVLKDTTVVSESFVYQSYQSQSYSISLGSTELCKIGDYQDYIYKSGDGWYVHKEVGRVLLDGTMVPNSTIHDYLYYIGRNTMGITTGYLPNIGLSDHFVYNTDTRITDNNSANQFMGDGQIAFRGGENSSNWDRMYFKSSKFATAADFRTWFSANNVSIYYALATPTDTKITDDTLVAQLNALGAMKLFIGENNLIAQSTGTNLPALLSFKYYTTVAMTGAEWEEGGSGGATVVEVDSITNTYPIWRVKGPAVDPQLSVINTNTTIRYTGTVTGTQTLEIDMFNKTAKLNGVSVIGNVSGDWVSLAPGTNRVIYTAENADAQPSTIEWQEVVG